MPATRAGSKAAQSTSESPRASPAGLYVYVPDCDAVCGRALGQGAESLEPPLDTPYGDRRAMIRDGWGNTWQVATRVRAEG